MNATDTRPEGTRPRWLVPALVAGGLLLAVVLALTQPWGLWIDQEVNETLPTITGDTSAPSDDRDAEGDATSDDTETAPATGSEDPAAEDGDTTMQDGDTTTDDDEALADDTEDSEDTEAPTVEPSPTPSGPVELATGSFISRDHTTTGRVAIVRLEDGGRVLTIEDLQTDNGPDLYVYLDDGPADGPESGFDDGIDLGRLRGNVGDLVYEIPDDLDIDDVASVAIWCDRFSSLFGAADLVRS